MDKESFILDILETVPIEILIKCYESIIKKKSLKIQSKETISFNSKMDAITLTFGDCMENHAGMQKLGEMSERGYSYEDLINVRNYFKDLGAETKLYNLNKLLPEEYQELVDDTAYLLIIKKGTDYLYSDLSEKLYEEHISLQYDKHYYDTRRNKVLNKLARWNLCFDVIGQEADYQNKKGTVVCYNNVPYTNILKDKISHLIGDHDLKLEANYYYDLNKTGIGYHGDTERKKVIGVRIGKDNKIAFKWFKNSTHIGKKFQTILSNGDIYIMSEKTVGTDWKKRSMITLRHAAGADKYTN